MNYSLFSDRMTKKQAAEVLGLSPETLAIWLHNSRIIDTDKEMTF